MTPDVSVLMPVWNPHPVHFPAAVRSVLAQTHPSWELIIVEDPGTTSATSCLAGVGDSRIRLITNTERTGLIAQRNRTLAEARAEFVAFLDADDLMEPDRLTRQMETLGRHPEIVVLGCQLTIIDSNGVVIGHRAYPTTSASIRSAMPRFNAIPQPGVMARASAIRSVGGYRFEFPVEDYDLWSRMLRAGFQFANHPDALVQYRVGGATKGDKIRTTLRLTRQVKREQWWNEMTFRDRGRYWAEGVLEWLPPGLVYRLFKVTQFRRS